MCAPILLGIVALFAGELWLLIHLGRAIGSFETVLLVLLTAAVGLSAVRGQSLEALQRMQRHGHLPRRAEMLESPLLLLAALCLLIPGFITDTIGALLLLPPLRRAVARHLTDRGGGPPRSGGGGGGGPSNVIEQDGETIIVVKPKDPAKR